MGKTRLEAFSDGVIAILITIMVLEFKTPEGHDWAALTALSAKFCAYVLSFVFLGIYWNNHHHMFHVTKRVTGGGAVGEPAPALLAVAGAVRDGVDGRDRRRAGADRRLRRRPPAGRRRVHDPRAHDHRVAGPALAAEGGGRQRQQGQVSVLLYAVAIPLAFVTPWISAAIYAAVALMWLVPDRRIEKHLQELT